MQSTRPLAVVVVAFHAPDALRTCLSQMAHQLPVTVVDNSSDEAVREVARQENARYIDAGGNIGFGAGVNIALRNLVNGLPLDILLVNPDVEIGADALSCLAAQLHQPGWEDVAVVAPRLMYPDGRAQRVSWPFPSPWRAWLEGAGLGRFNRAQDYVVGAVMAMRFEAIEQVGLFDERFFLYAEETDWQRRAHALGWRSAVSEEQVAVHVGGGTSTDSLRREHLFHAGGETYVRKWFGARGWWWYRLAVMAGAAVRGLVLPRDERLRARRRLVLYLRGPRRVAFGSSS